MFLDSVPSPEWRLHLNDTFTFSCHSDLACFNKCCRNKHLPLTPYDVLRLRNSVGLDSNEFLSMYTLYWIDPGSGFPVVCLKMEDTPEKNCPFVGESGCKVYEDRPTACRLFPLGRASGVGPDRATRDEFFFRLDAPGCLGVKEKRLWDVKAWQDCQGLYPYTEMNDRMLDLLFHPKRDRTRPLDESQLQKVMVACYNLDLFREFVLETRFREIYEIDERTCSRVIEDDKSLLDLGFAYLRQGLFVSC